MAILTRIMKFLFYIFCSIPSLPYTALNARTQDKFLLTSRNKIY